MLGSAVLGLGVVLATVGLGATVRSVVLALATLAGDLREVVFLVEGLVTGRLAGDFLEVVF